MTKLTLICVMPEEHEKPNRLPSGLIPIRRNHSTKAETVILKRGIIKEFPRNIVKEIKQYQEKWLQHVQRTETNRLHKQALQYKLEGRRHIGRPRKKWKDQFHFEDTRNRKHT